MAIYHCSIKMIKRSEGRSAVAAAAYRSGTRLTNEWDGMIHDYTKKGGIVHSEILLPANAPASFSDRFALWNSVEKIEKSCNAQLAREIEVAIPNELPRSEQIKLVQDYCAPFANDGMCVDFSIHAPVKEQENVHAHIMLTIRPLKANGEWDAKCRKEYDLDERGQRIPDGKGGWKNHRVNLTDWNEQTKAEEWRAAWARLCNQTLEQYEHAERIDHRSYERQGINQIPTVHLGVAASAMEKRGIRTGRGDLNREIEVTNQKLRQLKARISKLQNWLKEEAGNTEPPTLADYIQGILSRKAQAGKTGYSQSLYNLKDAAKMLNFLQTNNIMDMAGLDEKFKSMIGEQLDIQGKLKPVERRLATLKKHLEQADIYFKCKGKKPLTEAEQILFTTAKDYLKGVMNGKTTIPTKTWKEEYTKLTAERKTLNQRYLALKEEVKEAEKIRKSVYSILRQEQREQQPHRKQDVER